MWTQPKDDVVASTELSVLNLNNQRKSFGQRPLTEQDEREQGLMRIYLECALEQELFEALFHSP